MKKRTAYILILLQIILATSIGVFLVISKMSSIEKNLYPVQDDGKWGYIDNTGKLVIEPHFDMADEFYDGCAIVQVKDIGVEEAGVKYGVIDTSGKMVVKPDYTYICKYDEGITGALVENDEAAYNFQYCLLNTKGEVLYNLPEDIEIISMLFDGIDIPTQSEGMISVRNVYTELYGYMDSHGKMIIPCQYYEGYPYTEGLALVRTQEGYQYIDKNGKVIINANKYLYCRTFSEGLAAVGIQENDQSMVIYGYIDTKGNMKIEPQFSKAYAFSEGLAKVCIGEGINQFSTGYIDQTGAYRIGPNAKDNIEETSFSESLAAIDDGSGGYMDKEGKLVINPVVVKAEDNYIKNNKAGEFRGGIAKVSLSDGSVGYIDKTGTYIWQPSK